jgi:ribose transport system permease protein
VLGGTQLLGGRGSVAGVVAGSLTLTALFTVLNLIGLPKPLRDAVQGGVLVAAVAYSVRRQTKA